MKYEPTRYPDWWADKYAAVIRACSIRKPCVNENIIIQNIKIKTEETTRCFACSVYAMYRPEINSNIAMSIGYRMGLQHRYRASRNAVPDDAWLGS
jgi:hypothetical protein